MMIECQKALYLCCGDVGQRMFHQGPDGYSQQALSQPNNLNLRKPVIVGADATESVWFLCQKYVFFTRLAPLLQLQP